MRSTAATLVALVVAVAAADALSVGLGKCGDASFKLANGKSKISACLKCTDKAWGLHKPTVKTGITHGCAHNKETGACVRADANAAGPNFIRDSVDCERELHNIPAGRACPNTDVRIVRHGKVFNADDVHDVESCARLLHFTPRGREFREALANVVFPREERGNDAAKCARLTMFYTEMKATAPTPWDDKDFWKQDDFDRGKETLKNLNRLCIEHLGNQRQPPPMQKMRADGRELVDRVRHTAAIGGSHIVAVSGHTPMVGKGDDAGLLRKFGFDIPTKLKSAKLREWTQSHSFVYKIAPDCKVTRKIVKIDEGFGGSPTYAYPPLRAFRPNVDANEFIMRDCEETVSSTGFRTWKEGL